METELLKISRDEQKEAHWRAFWDWWCGTMVPVLREQKASRETIRCSFECHWEKWQKEKIDKGVNKRKG